MRARTLLFLTRVADGLGLTPPLSAARRVVSRTGILAVRPVTPEVAGSSPVAPVLSSPHRY
jgi:hypothetical protein